MEYVFSVYILLELEIVKNPEKISENVRGGAKKLKIYEKETS